MATKSNRLVPARLIHPGEILREELQERGIKQKDFASQIGIQATHLNEFIKGKRNLNEELAMKLEKHLGIPYQTWMNLHNGYIYDKKAVEEKQEEEQNSAKFESVCSSFLNLHLLYKRLGITHVLCKDRVAALKETIGFDLLSANELRLQVAGLYKHSEKVQIDEKNMLTWLVLNLHAVKECEKPEKEYAKGDAVDAAKEIAYMANTRMLSVDNIKNTLRRHGIAYVEVPKVDKAPVDAYSTFKDSVPVITTTYRYNDMDKLAFDILHELCHVDRHLSQEVKAFISVEGTDYSKDPREIEANDFARQMLIPNHKWDKILSVGCKSLSPHKVVRAIADEAIKLGISPSIAVARYKHDTNWYKTAAYKSPRIQ